MLKNQSESEQYKMLFALIEVLTPEPTHFSFRKECEGVRDFWNAVIAQGEDVSIEVFLTHLNVISQERWHQPFTVLSATERMKVFRALTTRQPRMSADFIRILLGWFYSRNDVLTFLGQTGNAPFPFGHAVEAGDLSLLEDVVHRGSIFRHVG